MKGRRKFLPITVIGLLLILMLATVGVVATLWYDTLEINGVVNTGNLDARFASAVCTDNDDTISHGDGAWKDIGECTTELWTGPQGDNGYDTGQDKVHFIINKAYPFYNATITATLVNAGNIPFHTSPWAPRVIDAFGATGQVTATAITCDCPHPIYDHQGLSAAECVTTGEVGTQCVMTSCQLHEGEQMTCAFKIEIGQAATENTEYKGCLQFPAWQYNEEPNSWAPTACIWGQ